MSGMLVPDDAIQSNPLVKPFLLLWQEILPSEKFDWVGAQYWDLQIAAPTVETGPLWVSFQYLEYTVGLGKLYHTHFETYLYSNPPKQRHIEAEAARAIDFIRDVLDDRVEFRVTLIEGNPVRCSLRYADEPGHFSATVGFGQPTDREQQIVRYRWSGRVD